MNKMIGMMVVGTVLAMGSGCTSMKGALIALGQDKNNVSVQVTTIYGNLRYARTGTIATNSVTSVASDGSITTKTP